MLTTCLVLSFLLFAASCTALLLFKCLIEANRRIQASMHWTDKTNRQVLELKEKLKHTTDLRNGALESCISRTKEKDKWKRSYEELDRKYTKLHERLRQRDTVISDMADMIESRFQSYADDCAKEKTI